MPTTADERPVYNAKIPSFLIQQSTLKTPKIIKIIKVLFILWVFWKIINANLENNKMTEKITMSCKPENNS